MPALLRHWLVAWRRNLMANRLLSAIALLGLAIGLTGAILMALVARIPLGYNGHVPDRERTYLAVSLLSAEGMAPNYSEATPPNAVPLIRANVGEVEASARVEAAEVELRRATQTVRETIYWADPETFDLYRLERLHGDPVAALRSADALVMTRAAALRFFGRENALGQTIAVDGVSMTLRAVIADPPHAQTDLVHGVFASGLAAGSPFARPAALAEGAFAISVRSYVRLRDGISPEAAQQRIAAVIDGSAPAMIRDAYSVELVRIDALALHEGFHPGMRQRLLVGGLVAALILFIAAANFVNLSTALAARRRREIGVRKASGASRGHIAAQFLIEAVLTVLVAALIAVAASEWLLPHLNAFIGSEASFDYVSHPALLLWATAGALLLGLVSGAYPALLLSAERPSAILTGKAAAGQSGGRLRAVLVTGQFAILIGLVIATAVVHQQRRFALEDALRVDVDRMLTVKADCPQAFVDEAAKLPGVRGVSCSGQELLSGDTMGVIERPNGQVVADMVSALPGLFALYGIEPVAGTLSALPPQGEETASRILLNETAVRRFGFASPAAALGAVLPIPRNGPGDPIEAKIVAVVPDFAFYSIAVPVEPTIYVPRPHSAPGGGLVSLRLEGARVPETLAAIDRLWRATGNEGPVERSFLTEHLAELYRGLERGTQLFAIFSGVAIFLACLGLVGLSLAAAERRTKEIAIRKALGARTGQIVQLLLWQLSRPVLWANLIAWPLAWLLLQRWLNGFAYRVPLEPWLFPAAGLLALTLALASVAGLAWRVARRKPVDALRYE